MDMQFQPNAIKLALLGIFASSQLNSQGLDVVVHFPNDSTRSGNLLSVGDSSIVVQFPEYQWDPRSQEVPVSQIEIISFTITLPGEASTLAQVAGTMGGVIVGSAIAGWAVAPTSAKGGFGPPGEVFIGVIVGGIAGGILGAELVNPSKSEEIRLDPKFPEQRDSLRGFLGNR